MTDSALPRPPETIEGFRIGALRRSAGALAVHAAVDRLDLAVDVHLVALAAMPPSFGPESFTAALRRAADVRHESLLPYVTGGRSGDLLFAVAKTLDAPALDEVIARGGRLADDRVLSIGVSVAGVLAALERSGLRHADLTPRRILLPGRGQLAVTVPRILPPEVAPRNERYLSPEEARGERGDVRSDLFVLGLLLAEATLGAPLVRGSAAEAKRTLAAGSLPSTDAASPRVNAVLARLLAASPAGRYPNASAAEAAIRAALEGAAPVPAAAAPIPLIVALDDSPPETAPIHLITAAADAPIPVPIPIPVDDAPHPDAPAPAPVPWAAATAPPSRAAAGVPEGEIRRSPGRLYLVGRLGESMLELDESVHVGRPAGANDIAARAEPFPEAEFVVERTPDADVLRTLAREVRVNGAVTANRALQNGDTIEGTSVRGRYELAARTALRATGAGGGPPPDPTKARLVLAAGLVIALLGIGVSLPKFMRARDDAEEAALAARDAERALETARRAEQPAATEHTVSVAAGPTREQEARDAYDAVKDWARKNPNDAAGARERLREVTVRWGDTGHGALAQAELAETDRRARAAGGGEIERLLETTRRDAAEGRLDEALNQLRVYSESHPGTIAAERARAAAVRIENEVVGRFEADVVRVERAIASKDWAEAIRLVDAAMDYVPQSMKNRARELRRRAEAGRDGGDASASKPPVAGPETPQPEPPPPPHDGQPGAGTGPGTAPPPPAGTGDREKDADAAFRAAKRLMEGGKDEEAIDALLLFLRDWKDTKVGAKYDVEARSRVTALAQGSAGISKLFRGKTAKLEKGRWRIAYDFQDGEQLKDFRDVEAFEAPPRAQWKLLDGAARAKGSGALVLDATFAVDQLVVSVTVSPERAHDLGVTFLDASEPRRYYLFTLQNSFFTLGKGEGAKVFEENAIVLFGPGMWRDTPPGQLGFVRKCGSAEPALRPGETAPVKCGKAEGQVWMRLEGGRQISGSAYGDIKVEFQGIEPGVFVMNSSGAFDDLVVEGTPEPNWVAARWRAILAGL